MKPSETELEIVPREERALRAREAPSLVLSEEHIETVMANINLLTSKFSDWLVDGEDYTTRLFPGQRKPRLLDPGSQKLCSFFNVYPKHSILERIVETKEGGERIRYIVEATLHHIVSGAPVASGVGSCSSDEKKYKYRWVNEDDLREIYGYGDEDLKDLKPRERGRGRQYYVRNPEILDLDNTILKMAAKRAEVDATLVLPGVASIFTQDVSRRSRKGERKPKKVSAQQTAEPTVKPDKVTLKVIEYNLKAAGVDAALVDVIGQAGGFVIEPKRDLGDDEWYKINGTIENLGGAWEQRGLLGRWVIKEAP